MKPIGVFDVETDPFLAGRSPKVFLAGFYDGKTLRYFWGPNAMVQCWAVMRKFNGYIYAHSGGKFDFRYLLPFVAKLRDKPTVKNIKGRIAKLGIPGGPEFRDSYCLLPVPLAAHKKAKIDYAKFEANRRNHYKREIIAYWKVDMYSLYELVTAFVGEFGFGLTMAGRTFDQLKRNFGLNPPKSDEHYDALFRRYYYGGRVEFFVLGRQTGSYMVLDINSAYPAAMLQKHAFGTEFKVTSKLPKNEKRLQVSFIRFRGSCEGGLPWRDDEDALSFKPHAGEFFVTGWEFVAAQRAGVVSVDKVLSVYEPTDCRDFSAFVHHFYKRKAAAKKGSPEELFAKLFLNSCYGRFALNPREFKDVLLTDYREEPEENNEWRKKIDALINQKHPGIRGEALEEMRHAYWQGFEGKWELANDFEDVGISVWERPAEVKSNSFFNVATAASITGCVRAFLFESLRKCADPVYCDTDSIICRDPGKLVVGSSLGEWKVEARGKSGGLWIAGKKLYALRLAPPYKKKNEKPILWKYAAKGVKLEPREICRVAEGNTVKHRFAAPTFSLFTSKNALTSDFITRTIKRDDQREKRRVTNE